MDDMSKGVVDGIATAGAKYKHMRQYYTPENAQSFLSTFERVIKERKNITILSAKTGLKTSTLHLRANDALRWLIDNAAKEDDRKRFALLRLQITIAKIPEGVVLKFKENLLIEATTLNPTEWRNEFDEWFRTAQPEDIFHKENIIVTDIDKERITNMMAGVSGPTTELEITATSIKIMR